MGLCSSIQCQSATLNEDGYKRTFVLRIESQHNEAEYHCRFLNITLYPCAPAGFSPLQEQLTESRTQFGQSTQTLMSINVLPRMLSVVRCKTWAPISNQLHQLSGRSQTFRGRCAFNRQSSTEKSVYQMSTGSDSHKHRVSSSGRKGQVLILSGYTCIGKTFCCNDTMWRQDLKLGEVVDMDSSTFKRDRFPQNYLEAIRQKAQDPNVSIILVSTFPGVATELKNEGYYVAQVYPDENIACKNEWLRRLENREQGGRESRLYKLVDANWDVWFQEMGTRDVSKSIPVSSAGFLSNVIKDIYRSFLDSRGGGGGTGAEGIESTGRDANA